MPQDRTKIRVGPGTLYFAAVGATEPARLDSAWPVSPIPWASLGYTQEGSTFTIAPNFEDVEVAEEFDPIDILMTGRALTVEFALAQMTAENMQMALNGATLATNNVRTQATVNTTTTSPALTGPAGTFDAIRDIGAAITGTGIPASTTIIAVASPTAATMSANATATAAVTVTITQITGLGEKTVEPLPVTTSPVYIALGWEDNLTFHKERFVWRKCIQSGSIEIARQKAPNKATIPASFRVALPTAGQAFRYYVADN